MRMVVCTVKDQKVDAYLQPFFVRSRGEAIRSFSDLCCDSKHLFGQHPEDFYLVMLAEFDDNTGEFIQGPALTLLAGLDAVSARQK